MRSVSRALCALPFAAALFASPAAAATTVDFEGLAGASPVTLPSYYNTFGDIWIAGGWSDPQYIMPGDFYATKGAFIGSNVYLPNSLGERLKIFSIDLKGTAAIRLSFDYFDTTNPRQEIIVMPGTDFSTFYLKPGVIAGVGIGAVDGSTIGIDNIVFENVSGVPEPRTWALMITGLGLAGAGLRRARRQETTLSRTVRV